MRIFFSVGEPSGDEHAAALIHALKQRAPNIECEGFGGEGMRAAGCDLQVRLTDYAVMGIMQVLPLIWTFLKFAWKAKKHFRESPPDVVVLVDFPGFNWWIAHYAKQAGIRVVYYLPPQLWAWAPWRIKRMQRNVDYVLSGLSFEKEWYEKHHVKTEFVSHPFFDEVAEKKLDDEFVSQKISQETPLIGILPGSRTMEVHRNWSVMTEIISRLHKKHPTAKFIVANYREKHREHCMQNMGDLPDTVQIEFHTGKTSEIIEASTAILMVSGSVSLELLAREKPAVVMYRGGIAMTILAKLLVTCQYMTLPNLMAKKPLYPEFPFCFGAENRICQMTKILDHWLSEPLVLESKREELRKLKAEVVKPGATERVAEFLVQLDTSANKQATETDSIAA